jgi:hypothetical protein
VIAGTGATIALVLGALILSALAVLIDRLNFPQRPFRSRGGCLPSWIGTARDRTGAHMVDEDGEVVEPSNRRSR